MARYLFQADYRGVRATDDIGEEFPTLQEAEAHAAIVANELGRNTAEAVAVSVLSDERRRTVGEITLGAMPIRCKGLGDAIFPRRDDPHRFRLVVPGL